MSPCPIPATITITPWAPPFICCIISHNRTQNEVFQHIYYVLISVLREVVPMIFVIWEIKEVGNGGVLFCFEVRV